MPSHSPIAEYDKVDSVSADQTSDFLKKYRDILDMQLRCAIQILTANSIGDLSLRLVFSMSRVSSLAPQLSNSRIRQYSKTLPILNYRHVLKR